jgi:hypothetical protein
MLRADIRFKAVWRHAHEAAAELEVAGQWPRLRFG